MTFDCDAVSRMTKISVLQNCASKVIGVFFLDSAATVGAERGNGGAGV